MASENLWLSFSSVGEYSEDDNDISQILLFDTEINSDLQTERNLLELEQAVKSGDTSVNQNMVIRIIQALNRMQGTKRFRSRVVSLLFALLKQDSPLSTLIVATFCFHSFSLDIDVINRHEPNPRGIVILLGWGGSRMSELEEIDNYYKQIEFSSIKCIRSSVPGILEEQIQAIVEQLDIAEQSSASISGLPVVIHMFSNNGVLCFADLISHFHKTSRTDILDSINGIVMDSAPLLSMDSNSAWRVIGRTIASMLQSIGVDDPLKEVLSIRRKILNYIETHSTFWNWGVIIPVLLGNEYPMPLCPWFCIYSSTDAIVPVNDVQTFISTNKSRVLNMKSWEVEGSQHCQHFLTFQEEYSNRLLEFLENECGI